MAVVSMKVYGLGKITTTLYGAKLLDYIAWQPVKDASKVAMPVMRRVAPKWEYRIQSSIMTQQDRRNLEATVGHVKTVPRHATFMEHGTGRFRLDDSYRAAPTTIKFPNVTALEKWAFDKGLEAFAVAKGIYNRGGLAPRMYIRAGEAAARDYIDNILPAQFNARMNFEID